MLGRIAPALSAGLMFLLAVAAQASVMGRDDRLTFAAFAQVSNRSLEQIEQTYAATGLIRCQLPNRKLRESTAQLTGSPSLVTTAGHTFFDLNGRPLPIKSCAFVVKQNGRENVISIDLKSSRIGSYRPNDARHDWAVLRLSRPAPETISPYLVPQYDFLVPPWTRLTQVSGFSFNFELNGTRPRHLTHCQVRDVLRFDVYPLQTDCDSGSGTSGSAQLIETAHGPMVVALHVANSRDMDGPEYDAAINFNVSTPLTGEFLRAIHEALQPNLTAQLRQERLPAR